MRSITFVENLRQVVGSSIAFALLLAPTESLAKPSASPDTCQGVPRKHAGARWEAFKGDQSWAKRTALFQFVQGRWGKPTSCTWSFSGASSNLRYSFHGGYQLETNTSHSEVGSSSLSVHLEPINEELGLELLKKTEFDFFQQTGLIDWSHPERSRDAKTGRSTVVYKSQSITAAGELTLQEGKVVALFMSFVD